MKNTYRIAEINFGRSHWNAFYEFDFDGDHFEVHRYGANFSVEAVKKIIELNRSSVDSFALSSFPPSMKLNERTFVHRQFLEIMSTPSPVPLCDGAVVRELFNLKGLIKAIQDKLICPEFGVFLPMVSMAQNLGEYLAVKYPESTHFGDAYSLLGIPALIKPFRGVQTLGEWMMNFSNFRDLKSNTPVAESTLHRICRSALGVQVETVQTILGDLSTLLLFDSAKDFIRNKDVIIWNHHPLMEQELTKFQPRSVIQLFPAEYKLCSYMNHSLLDCILRLKQGRSSALTWEEWEELIDCKPNVRTMVRRYSKNLRSSKTIPFYQKVNHIKNKLKNETPIDFAFVVHALSREDFARIPGLQFVKKLPEKLAQSLETAVGKVPGFEFGEIRGIVSELNGRSVRGKIYTLGATPRVLRQEPVEVTYAKIQKLCVRAANQGAKIIGLGAYTKVIGDNGITINNNSPIPVTTGNSLSASATLWGVHDVLNRMQLVAKDKNTNLFKGRAMVIGATGSIGKVSALLLSRIFKKIVLIAPRLERLNALKLEIEKLSPLCQVDISTNANDFAATCDVLLTATSACDQKIVNVAQLKSGCVVCDCSRPLDFTIDDTKSRPDILIIESGELYLPGPVEMTCDLGLPGKTVYACLAETALLALEERYESFTLGRNIEIDKVKEIYKMAVRHGARLSAIRGHMGFISDREILLIKELAQKKRRQKNVS